MWRCAHCVQTGVAVVLTPPWLFHAMKSVIVAVSEAELQMVWFASVSTILDRIGSRCTHWSGKQCPYEGMRSGSTGGSGGSGGEGDKASCPTTTSKG